MSIGRSTARSGRQSSQSQFKIGYTAQNPCNWMVQAERDCGLRLELTSEEQARIKALGCRAAR